MQDHNCSLLKKNQDYSKPKVEVIDFSYEDIIRTSGCEPVCPNVGCMGRDNESLYRLKVNLKNY